MYLNRITLIGFIGSDAERKAANCNQHRDLLARHARRPGRTMPEPGNRAPSGIDAWPSGNSPISPAPSPKGAHVAIEGELRSHDYQRELAVGTQKTTLAQRVWEVRVDSILKLDRAAKRETTADGSVDRRSPPARLSAWCPSDRSGLCATSSQRYR